MKKKLVIANWKMNGDIKFTNEFVNNLTKLLQKDIASHNNPLLNNVNNDEQNIEIVICPPFPLLYPLNTKIIEQGSNIYIGGQNCHSKSHGAYTGEISAKMLVDSHCKYVIIGHSERRSNNFENSSSNF